MMPRIPIAVEVLIILVLIVIAFRRIFKKAGFSPWLSLLMCIPFVNLVMLYFLAYARWPNSK